MISRAAVLACLSIIAAGCSRDLPPVNLKALAQEAQAILESDRPLGVAAPIMNGLAIEPLILDDDGIYIPTGKQLVEEWGYFIPYDAEFSPPEGGDPAYRLVGEGVWRYDIAG